MSDALTSSQLEGVYVPVVTPFRADESVDETAFANAIEYLLDAGVAGVVVGGTTGEYYAMSMDERLAQLELGAKLVAGRAQLIAGCNSGATRDAITYASHARGHGYGAVMLAAPPTSLPSQTELAHHVVAVAEGGGLPIVLYNFPMRAGVEFGLESLDALADRDDVIAIKESSGDFSRLLTLVHRYAGRIEIMCGSDDQTFDYMSWGVRSWLAGTANVLPSEHVQFTNTMLAGNHDLGRRQYSTLLSFLQHMEAGRYNAKVKAGLRHLGVEVGAVRRPLQPLSPVEEAELFAEIDGAIAAFTAVTNG